MNPWPSGGRAAGLLLVALVVGACSHPAPPVASSPSAAPTRDTSQVFVWPLIGATDVTTVDPGLSSDGISNTVITIYDAGLVDLDASGRPVPGAAASWELSADRLRYTFHLRAGLHFSDGTPLVAQDFVDSINRALSPALGSQAAPTYDGDVAGAHDVISGRSKAASGLTAPDDHTVVVQLERPIQYFLAEFAFPTGDPLKKTSYDPQTLKLITDRPVGIGPFVISSYNHGHEIDFAPNPYWYEGRLQLKQVRMPFILDGNTAYKEYQAGQTMLTFTGSGGPDAKKPDFHNQSLLQTDALYINWTRPPFDDPRVRTAFAEATDVAAYSQAVGAGNPTHQWIPPGMPGYSSDLEQHPVVPFDAAKARADLAAAGYPGGQGLPTISIAYAASGPGSATAPLALQTMWKQNLGVTIGLYQKPLSQLFTDDLGGTAAKDQLFFLSWVADYPDPHDWTSVLWHKGAYYNTTGFHSDQFDALVDAADVESDQAKRLQEYLDAERILLQQVGIVPLDNPSSAYLLSPRVRGFRLDTQGGVPPSVWAGVYITG